MQSSRTASRPSDPPSIPPRSRQVTRERASESQGETERAANERQVCVCVSEKEAGSGCAQWRCTTVFKLLCWVRGELSSTLARKCARVLCLRPWQLPGENGATSKVLFETWLTSNLAVTFLCMPNSVDSVPPAPSSVCVCECEYVCECVCEREKVRVCGSEFVSG